MRGTPWATALYDSGRYQRVNHTVHLSGTLELSQFTWVPALDSYRALLSVKCAPYPFQERRSGNIALGSRSPIVGVAAAYTYSNDQEKAPVPLGIQAYEDASSSLKFDIEAAQQYKGQAQTWMRINYALVYAVDE